MAVSRQAKAVTDTPGASKRCSLTKIQEPVTVLDLLGLQRGSFVWLIGTPEWRVRRRKKLGEDARVTNGLEDILEELSPIEDYSQKMSLTLSDPWFGSVKNIVDESKDKDINYPAPLYVTTEFTNRETGEIRSQTVFIGDFPMIADKGTFIVNGTERVVVSQLVHSPGVYSDETIDKSTERPLHLVKIIPSHDVWLEFDIDKWDTVGVRIDRKHRQPVTVLLKAFGWTTEEIKECFGFSEIMMAILEKDDVADTDEALLGVYREQRPGEPLTHESALALLENNFFKPKRYDLAKVSRYKVSRKLDLGTEVFGEMVLTEQDIATTIEYLMHLHNDENVMTSPKGVEIPVEADDIDHSGNRRLRTVGGLIQSQVRAGLSRMERMVRERMTTQDVEPIQPTTSVNVHPVFVTIHEFFDTSQLSQFMDQNNSLSGLTHKRRLSALSPSGLTHDRANLEVRDVRPSHYDRMCPVGTPEGPNIGLVGSLFCYVRVNSFGFIETPYRRVRDGVITDEVDYFTADEENRYVVAQANTPINENGHFAQETLSIREKGGGVESVRADEVDYLGVSPRQMVSVATVMTPSLGHDDANRALVGASMQRQAVPLLCSEAPFVGTDMEQRAAYDADGVIVASTTSVVETVSANFITIMDDRGQRRTYLLCKLERTNQGTCYNQKPLADKGQRVETGQVIADDPGTDNGGMALGENLLVAFIPREGHNYEDATILNQRTAEENILTSIHIEEHEINARNTKLNPGEITHDISNVSEEMLKDLDERSIVRIGVDIRDGDILVAKTASKGETELTPEERLLRAIFGEKSREVRDAPMRVPRGESDRVIGVRVSSRKDDGDLTPGVDEVIRVHVAQKHKIQDGDKMVGRHDNKGVVGKILPQEDISFLPDGAPVDIILNTHGIPRHMNISQVLEVHFGRLAKASWSIEDDPDWAKHLPADLHDVPSDSLVATPVFDGTENGGPADLLASSRLNRDGEVLANTDGRATLLDGRSGEKFPFPVSVGYMYILKLHHLADEKIHTRSAGPYSVITQQPLGSKAQFGGQRFGRMEVWATQVYGAAYTLQELLTIKSDDVVGRIKVYEAVMRGDNIPDPGIPGSFKVLLKELQSLCLNVEVLSIDGVPIELGSSDDEELDHATVSLGINLSRDERSDVDPA